MAEKSSAIDVVRRFLDLHVNTRRTLIVLTTVAAPALLVLLPYGELLDIPKAVSATAAGVITLIAIGLGVVLAITESSAGEMASELLTLREDLQSARERIRRDAARRNQRESESEGEHDHLRAVSVFRDRLFFIINLALETSHRGGTITVPNALSLLLDELGGLAPFLFKLEAAERWSCAIYLLDRETQLLKCVGDVRNASKDDGSGHRAWPVGRGMVGVTAFTGRVLIVSDATESDLEGIIRDPDEARASEDRELYRSVVGIPIYEPDKVDGDSVPQTDDDNQPSVYGVVIATSDVAQRFQSEEDGEFSPLQALADAVAMVLIAADLSGRASKTPVGKGWRLGRLFEKDSKE